VRHARIKALFFLALLLIVPVFAQADDVIENLVFTGTATCTDGACAGFGTGPITGTYSFDVTTQTIVGPWSFSTPFGVLASTQAGARAAIDYEGPPYVPEVEADFTVSVNPPPFLEFVSLRWDPSNLTQLGPVAFADACIPVPGQNVCYPDYIITGSNVLAPPSPAPEPSALALLFAGLLAAVPLSHSLRKPGLVAC
jgi:hypothetical protein